MYTYMYNVYMTRPKSYKLKDARANLSQLIKELSNLGDCFVIEKRSTPRAAVIPYNEAVKLIPSLSMTDTNKTFFDFVETHIPKKKLRGNKVDISGKIDQILYGI